MKLYNILLLICSFSGLQAVTLYEYYTTPDVTSGLIAEGETFTLNGKDIRIFSGTFHYFRVHPSNWRDTLRKLRAAGLNSVETYMPWNLHNPRQGVYDFGDLGEDMSPFLDIRGFLQTAQEEDLFVILRPGPYICAEWEFGGLPSWLLRDPTMNLRTNYEGYVSALDAYVSSFSAITSDLTFTNGGPIMAIQIENEYGHFGYEDIPRDKPHLQHIYDVLNAAYGSDILYFTSDTPSDTLDWGSVPGVLMTANFQSNVDENLDTLKTLQPNRPLMVMEYWTGWFDHWLSEFHVGRDPDFINQNLNAILAKNSSVNMYMFIGGTNFGFMAGANKIPGTWPEYTPIVTSYDYDAPLTEAGDYGPKYDLVKETISNYNTLEGIVDNPDPPPQRNKTAYGVFSIQESLEFQALIDRVPTKEILSNGPVNMEALSLNDGNGQSYGYIVYTSTIDLPTGDSSLLIRGHVRDMAQVLINNEVATQPYSNPLDINKLGFWGALDQSLNFSSEGGPTQIQIMVENLGRVNYGKPHFLIQKKGLWEGPVMVNLKEVKDWEVTSLEFKSTFVNSLTNWEVFTGSYATPSAYRVTVSFEGELEDTFIDMSAWTKGVVFVNGFNLGRYWTVGPPKTLYLPSALLNQGDNEFVIFEQYEASDAITFIDHPKLGIKI